MAGMLTPFSIADSALRARARSCSHRLRSPIVAMAMALETLATSQPHRLGDFRYAPIKAGGNQ